MPKAKWRKPSKPPLSVWEWVDKEKLRFALRKMGYSEKELSANNEETLFWAAMIVQTWIQWKDVEEAHCKNCNLTFYRGARTGRRADSSFCTEKCRVRFNSLKRSGNNGKA